MSNKKTNYIKNLKLYFFASFFILLFSCNNQDHNFLPNEEEVSFSPIKGNFFSSDRNQDHILFVNAPASFDWETFVIEKRPNNLVSIRTSTGKRISYNNNDSILIGDAIEINNTELFVLKPIKEYFQLKTKNGGNIVINKKLQLQVSYHQEPLIFKIQPAKNLPKSILSFRELDIFPFVIQLSIFILAIFLFFKVFKKVIPNNRYSYYTTLVLGFILLYVIFNAKLWRKNEIIISDVTIYYEYLPATFIFNDLSFNFIDSLPKDFNGQIWVEHNSNTGKNAPKTTMGLSFMYLPFFLLGHLFANILGYTTYGYSNPYSMFISIGAWIYVFISLFYLRKILLNYFNDIVTSFTLFSIVLATNLFYYTTIEPGMSHAYSFFLFTMFLWLTIKWYQEKKIKTTILLGLCFGLITLIRPTNGLILLVFLLWDIKELKKTAVFLWNKKYHFLLFFIFSFLVWVPQFLFWKYATGNWFYFSYGEERFYFDNPRILEGMFSFRKGWLIYTPIIAFALIGIGFLFKQKIKLGIPIFTFVSLNIYIIYSWWCWWYGGSFGSRPMVESYVLLSIPLAAFYSFFDKKTNYFRVIPLFIIFITTALNLFQTQQTKTNLHYDSMTKEAYLTNFTAFGWPQGIEELMARPNYEKALKGEDEYVWNFD